MLRKLLGAQPITTPIDREISPLDEAQPLQLVEQRYILRRSSWSRVQGTEPIGAARLLRARRKWPRHRTPNHFDQIASPHGLTPRPRIATLNIAGQSRASQQKRRAHVRFGSTASGTISSGI